jgi:O-antigen/teichoic acid export membrane protein
VEPNPYEAPAEMPAGPNTGVLGWLFQLRHWWAGMAASFVIACAIAPADPYSIGAAFWLLATGYFLGVALRAWWVGRKALKKLAERRRRDYSSRIR